MLAGLLFYLMFAAYIPLKHRATRLEVELRDVYRREADLQTALTREEKRYSQRDRQAAALSRERNDLARRIETLERQIQATRRVATAAVSRTARRR